MPEFGRIASVTVGPAGGSGHLIKDQRITFNIHKTFLQSTNTCNVRIFNISETTHNKIDIDDTLILKAGYSEGAGEKVLFVGNVYRPLRRIKSPEIISDIECYDGEKVLRESKVELSYVAGASALSILNRVAESMNIPIRDVGRTLIDKQFLHGFSIASHSKTALDKLTAKLGLTWSIQNNEIQILPITFIQEITRPSLTSVYLSPETGLLETPEKLDIVLDYHDERAPGWKLTSLLNPEIEPGGFVTVKSRTVEGVFAIHNVRHRGDTHESENITVCEVYN